MHGRYLSFERVSGLFVMVARSRSQRVCFGSGGSKYLDLFNVTDVAFIPEQSTETVLIQCESGLTSCSKKTIDPNCRDCGLNNH